MYVRDTDRAYICGCLASLTFVAVCLLFRAVPGGQNFKRHTTSATTFVTILGAGFGLVLLVSGNLYELIHNEKNAKVLFSISSGFFS